MLTFADAPYSETKKAKYGFLGVPSGLGATTRGGAFQDAPREVRLAYSGDDYSNLVDLGDLIPDGRDLSTFLETLSGVMEQVATQVETAIVVGGDDSISYGVVKGIARNAGNPVRLFHYDAHSDTEDDLSNGIDHSNWVRGLSEEGHIAELNQTGCRVSSVTGNSPVYMATGDSSQEYPVVIVLDMDVFDPAFAPGVGCPEPFGLFPLDVLAQLKRIWLSEPVVAIVVTEIDPARDLNGMTSKLAFRIISNLLDSVRDL